ncbi:hypothetical protein WA026_008834 [Henosepilachna vigintioctopunctata]|uniref:Reverse transcriptase n=1 Tax=Henosepilachna vigintioctopunctata TaxID=420089 RepID=A0AAW1VCJ6_9CUCU
MGFRVVSHHFLESHPMDRKQYTSVHGHDSEQEVPHVGVGQGSVLEPLHYSLYVHTLKYVNLTSKYFMFANDTVLVLSSHDLEQIQGDIKSDFNLYHEWLLLI